MKKNSFRKWLGVIAILITLSEQAFPQANTSLSNLVSPTSVNQSLIPSANNSKSLGSSTLAWKDGWFMGKINIGGTATPTTMLDITPPTSSAGAINLKPNSALLPSTGELRFSELSANGSNYVGFKSPSSIAANKIWILPAADGTTGQVLSTNGSGALSWTTVSGGISGLTTNFIPKWNGSALVNGSFFDNGSKVGLGTSVPIGFLHINKAADSDNPQLWVKDASADDYARIYLSSFTNVVGDERKWKILGRTSTTDQNNNFYIQQVREISGSYVSDTRLYIDYDGKTGIGTSLPLAKLHVNTDFIGDEFIVGPETGTPHFIVDALGQGGLNVADPNSRLHINSGAGEDALRVQVNNLTKLFVSSNGGVSVGGSTTPPTDGLFVAGNAGIGTATPQVRLHVTGTDEVLRLDGTNPYMQFFSSSAAKSYIQQTGNDFKLGTVVANTSGKVQITAGSATAMTLNSSGNVGIGTTSPGARLHLKGTNEVLRIEGTGAFIQFYNASTPKSYVWRNGDDIEIGTSTGNNLGRVVLSTATGGDQLFVLPNGTVGIGISDTKGYKLGVDGSVVCEELKVKLSQNWPDYVFADEYKLPSLRDVANSISINKHLPGIPSAEEIHEDGINVGAMQKMMMQKIEELTLYVIDLQKQNDELKEQMKELVK